MVIKRQPTRTKQFYPHNETLRSVFGSFLSSFRIGLMRPSAKAVLGLIRPSVKAVFDVRDAFNIPNACTYKQPTSMQQVKLYSLI